MESTGKKLKKLRLSRSLSMDEMCDKFNDRFGAGINKSMVSKWENDISEPRLDTVRHMSIFFNVSLDYLLGVDDDDFESVAAHHVGEEWTEEELAEIEKFKRFVRSKRDEHPK